MGWGCWVISWSGATGSGWGESLGVEFDRLHCGKICAVILAITPVLGVGLKRSLRLLVSWRVLLWPWPWPPRKRLCPHTWGAGGQVGVQDWFGGKEWNRAWLLMTEKSLTIWSRDDISDLLFLSKNLHVMSDWRAKGQLRKTFWAEECCSILTK